MTRAHNQSRSEDSSRSICFLGVVLICACAGNLDASSRTNSHNPYLLVHRFVNSGYREHAIRVPVFMFALIDVKWIGEM